MFLSDMTYLEAKEYIKINNRLIIPVGTCEQHGPHLPLGSDTICAEYLASALSELSGCLVAPTINYGVNLPCDSTLTGTASLSPATLRALVSETTDWWRQQGFKSFLLVNVHGDPYHLRALSGVSDDIHLIEPCDIDYSDILEKQDTMRHSCEAETSVLLYLFPEAVRTGMIRESDIPFAEFRQYLYHENETPPERYLGCLGYPKSASAEKGRIIVERMKAKMTEDYEKIVKSQQ